MSVLFDQNRFMEQNLAALVKDTKAILQLRNSGTNAAQKSDIQNSSIAQINKRRKLALSRNRSVMDSQSEAEIALTRLRRKFQKMCVALMNAQIEQENLQRSSQHISEYKEMLTRRVLATEACVDALSMENSKEDDGNVTTDSTAAVENTIDELLELITQHQQLLSADSSQSTTAAPETIPKASIELQELLSKQPDSAIIEHHPRIQRQRLHQYAKGATIGGLSTQRCVWLVLCVLWMCFLVLLLVLTANQKLAFVADSIWTSITSHSLR